MKKNLITIAVVLLAGGVWAWYDLQNKPANEQLRTGIQSIIAREPRVKPIYDEAMTDGVLTTLEAKKIADKANELKGN